MAELRKYAVVPHFEQLKTITYLQSSDERLMVVAMTEAARAVVVVVQVPAVDGGGHIRGSVATSSGNRALPPRRGTIYLQ